MIEEISVKYIRRNNCSNKSCWNNNQRIFVPAITDGTVVPTMIVVTAVSTRAVGTAGEEIFFPQSLLEQLFPQRLLEPLFQQSLLKRHTIGNLAPGTSWQHYKPTWCPLNT